MRGKTGREAVRWASKAASEGHGTLRIGNGPFVEALPRGSRCIWMQGLGTDDKTLIRSITVRLQAACPGFSVSSFVRHITSMHPPSLFMQALNNDQLQIVRQSFSKDLGRDLIKGKFAEQLTVSTSA